MAPYTVNLGQHKESYRTHAENFPDALRHILRRLGKPFEGDLEFVNTFLPNGGKCVGEIRDVRGMAPVWAEVCRIKRKVINGRLVRVIQEIRYYRVADLA